LEPGPRGQPLRPPTSSGTKGSADLSPQRGAERDGKPQFCKKARECHLVGSREGRRSAPAPRPFAGRGGMRGRAISRTASNTIAPAEPELKGCVDTIAGPGATGLGPTCGALDSRFRGNDTDV
jgi:hypothetical protein